MNLATKKKVGIVVLILSVVLLVLNLLDIDYSTANYRTFFGPISNILLAFAMIYNLRQINKALLVEGK